MYSNDLEAGREIIRILALENNMFRNRMITAASEIDALLKMAANSDQQQVRQSVREIRALIDSRDIIRGLSELSGLELESVAKKVLGLIELLYIP